jgi:hypothetical protein
MGQCGGWIVERKDLVQMGVEIQICHGSKIRILMSSFQISGLGTSTRPIEVVNKSQVLTMVLTRRTHLDIEAGQSVHPLVS